MVTNNLEEQNLTIIKERYQMFADGQAMIGFLGVGKGKGPLQMMLGVRNSYDKSSSVAIAAGAMVIICSNGMVSGDVTYMRRHTGDVLDHVNQRVECAVKSLTPTLDKSLREMRRMEKVQLTENGIAHILGELFYKEELLRIQQLSVVKNEILTSDNFKMVDTQSMNLWNLYNNVTESLKNTNINGLRIQANVHDYFVAKAEPKVLNIHGSVLQPEPLFD